jgi:hypothetical protein
MIFQEGCATILCGTGHFWKEAVPPEQKLGKWNYGAAALSWAPYLGNALTLGDCIGVVGIVSFNVLNL